MSREEKIAAPIDIFKEHKKLLEDWSNLKDLAAVENHLDALIKQVSAPDSALEVVNLLKEKDSQELNFGLKVSQLKNSFLVVGKYLNLLGKIVDFDLDDAVKEILIAKTIASNTLGTVILIKHSKQAENYLILVRKLAIKNTDKIWDILDVKNYDGHSFLNSVLIEDNEEEVIVLFLKIISLFVKSDPFKVFELLASIKLETMIFLPARINSKKMGEIFGLYFNLLWNLKQQKIKINKFFSLSKYPIPYAQGICEFLMTNSLTLEQLKFFKAMKVSIFYYLARMRGSLKQEYLEAALDRETGLGQFLYIQKGVREPDLCRGYLSGVLKQYSLLTDVNSLSFLSRIKASSDAVLIFLNYPDNFGNNFGMRVILSKRIKDVTVYLSKLRDFYESGFFSAGDMVDILENCDNKMSTFGQKLSSFRDLDVFHEYIKILALVSQKRTLRSLIAKEKLESPIFVALVSELNALDRLSASEAALFGFENDSKEDDLPVQNHKSQELGEKWSSINTRGRQGLVVDSSYIRKMWEKNGCVSSNNHSKPEALCEKTWEETDKILKGAGL